MKEQNGKNISPEEAFDRRIISGGYVYFIWVLIFLFSGISCFTGLFSKGAAAGTAGIFASVFVPFIVAPLLWEIGPEQRPVRRIRRQAFLPIRTKAFILSKVKVTGYYMGIFCLITLALQVIGWPLFGVDNVLVFQGTLLLAGGANLLVYLLLGIMGAHWGE